MKKLDIHCHILPKEWPDLQKVNYVCNFCFNVKIFLEIWIQRLGQHGSFMWSGRQGKYDEGWKVFQVKSKVFI